MLSRFFQQLFASAGVVFRTIRAFFSRALSASLARVKSAASLTRQAAKLAPAMMKVVTDAGKKPSKREDYIETRGMFISKSFLIMAAVVLIALGALFYLVGWPWLMSHFLTAKMWYADSDTAVYSGKVLLYYEEDKQTVRFEGVLEDGLMQGDGKLFSENGLLLYEGGFSDGLYDGDGTLYGENGITVQATFQKGVLMGSARCYAGGTLYYEGGLNGLLPEGTGTLYGDGGKVLYTGPMKNGVIDGEALLTVSVEDLREMLGTRAKETIFQNGFSIVNPTLGLSVFCSFGGSDTNPAVYAVYLYPPQDDTLCLTLWNSRTAPETFLGGDSSLSQELSGPALPDFPMPLPVELGETPYRSAYRQEDSTFLLWRREQDSAPLLAEWRLNGDPPQADASTTVSSTSSEGTKTLSEQLSAALSGSAEQSNPYLGKSNAAKLLSAADRENRAAVLSSALTYYEYACLRTAAEKNLVLCQASLEEQQLLMKTGKGDAQTLSALENSADRLNVDIMKYSVQMRKDERSIREASGLVVADFDLQSLIFLFDASRIKVNALDTEASPAEIEDGISELILSYEDVRLTLRDYETALDNAAQAAQANATNTAGSFSTALTETQMNVNEQWAALCSAAADFARKAGALNEITDGALAMQIGWMAVLPGNE